MSRILILDIETAPKVALVWRFFKENISPKQVREHGHIMSYAAKWLNESTIYYQDNRTSNDKEIVQGLVNLLDEANIVIAHYGSKFDIPSIRARAVVHKLNPPSPFKIIDTYLVAKKEFNFPSNSLEYLTEIMDCKIKKTSHKKFPGWELWLECLRGNEEAWRELRTYNIDDILSLEELYLKMRPWITGHPQVNLDMDNEEILCPKCGSSHIHYRGFAYTQTGQYHRLQCQDCGGWSRTRYMLNKKNEKVLMN